VQTSFFLLYNETGENEGDKMNQDFIIANGSNAWVGKTWSRNIQLAKIYRSVAAAKSVVKNNVKTGNWRNESVVVQRLEF
jgi:hypothetical protein